MERKLAAILRAEDQLDFVDVEIAILSGKLVKTEKDDPRGVRYTCTEPG